MNAPIKVKGKASLREVTEFQHAVPTKARVKPRAQRRTQAERTALSDARMFDAALASPKGATAAVTAMERGVHAIACGNADAAIAAMQDALAADPRCARAHAHLAQLWWDKGTHDAALTALGHQRDALHLGRDDAETMELLASLLRRQGKADLAAALT